MVQYRRNAGASYAKRSSESIKHMFEYILEHEKDFSDDELENIQKLQYAFEILDDFANRTETKPLDGIELQDKNDEITLKFDTAIVERLEAIGILNKQDVKSYMEWMLLYHAIGAHDMMKVHYDMYKKSVGRIDE